MKKITLPFVLIFAINIISGQNPDWSWAKNYGSYNNDSRSLIAVGDNASVYLASNFNEAAITVGDETFYNNAANPALSPDFYLVKHSNLGNILWAKHIGGDPQTHVTSITADALGNLYVLGSAMNTIMIGENIFEGGGIFIIKYSPSGDILSIIEPSSTGFILGRIKVDIIGNIYISGSYNSTSVSIGNISLTNPNYNPSFNNANTLIAKLDSTGNVIWAKNTQCSGNSLFPNTMYDFAVDNAGNVFFGGGLWSDTIQIGDIVLTNNSITANSNIFIAKYDSDGNALWARQPSSTINTNNHLGSITCDQLGNAYFCGLFLGSMHLDGVTLNAVTSGNKMFILKTNSDGNALWGKTTSGVFFSDVHSCDTDESGNLYVGGTFAADPGQIINFGNGITNNSNNGSYFFATKYNANGAPQWVRTGGVSNANHKVSLDCFNSSQIYVAAPFNNYDSASMTLGNVTINHNSESYYNTFVALVASATLATDEYANFVFGVAPNPVSNFVAIENVMGTNNYLLTDTTGKVVLRGKIDSNAANLDLTDISAGIYFLKLENENGNSYIQRIIKQ